LESEKPQLDGRSSEVQWWQLFEHSGEVRHEGMVTQLEEEGAKREMTDSARQHH